MLLNLDSLVIQSSNIYSTLIWVCLAAEITQNDQFEVINLACLRLNKNPREREKDRLWNSLIPNLLKKKEGVYSFWKNLIDFYAPGIKDIHHFQYSFVTSIVLIFNICNEI